MYGDWFRNSLQTIKRALGCDLRSNELSLIPRGGAGIYACDIDSVELALATEVAIRYPQSPCRRRLTPLSSHRSRSLCDGAVERSRECCLQPCRFREFSRDNKSHQVLGCKVPGIREGSRKGLTPSTRAEPAATGAQRRDQEKRTPGGLERSDRITCYSVCSVS